MGVEEQTKKWVSDIPVEQHDWIKETADDLGVAGAVIIRTLLAKAMDDKSERLKDEIRSEQNKMKLQSINDRMAQLEQERQDLLKTGRREKVTA